MMTIGIDPHKQTHTAVAVDAAGRALSQKTSPARRDGFGDLLMWARALDRERVWVIEDCRHVSGPLERFLIDRGERVARLAPHLMANARRGARERGKSDLIDALAIAHAALRVGVSTLPTARLAGIELEIRQLSNHRERLIKTRTRLINDLRWQLHDLWPDWDIPRRVLIGTRWQRAVAQRLAAASTTARVRVARDEIDRIADLTRTINELHHELNALVGAHASHLLAERGMGPITAAKLIGEIAGIDRFHSDAALARTAGCAPIPVSSGRTDRHRLDRGGNRQLNHAFWRLATSRIRHDPETALYYEKQRRAGKTRREAIRSLKRHLVRRIYNLLTEPANTPQPALT
jgi:transposase